MKSMSLDCIKSTAAVIIAMLRSFENSSITNAGLFDWPAAADKVSGWLQCCSTAVDAAAVLVAQPKTGDNCTAAVGDILQPAVCPSRHQAGGRRELATTPRTQWLLLLHAYEEMRPRAAARAGEVLRGEGDDMPGCSGAVLHCCSHHTFS